MVRRLREGTVSGAPYDMSAKKKTQVQCKIVTICKQLYQVFQKKESTSLAGN